MYRNQLFNSSNAMPLISFVAISALIWTPAVKDNFEPGELATSSAPQRSAARAPASLEETSFEPLVPAGVLGVDPWGRPYHYKILDPLKSGKGQMLVWSSGPDGIAQTSAAKIASIQGAGSPVLSGDDVGIIVPIN